MKITYDKTVDAIYVYLKKKTKIASTKEMANGFVVDLDKKGNVVGIEILDASHQLSKDDVKGFEKEVRRGIPIQITHGTPVAA
jgi:uncharacterized protein YuzE